MYALSYGMFASHGPAYDSTFANLTVEDSKLGKGLRYLTYFVDSDPEPFGLGGSVAEP
jgi:hypothetical protein